MPVYTVTLYYGKELWNGPRDLHGLLKLQDVPEKLQDFLKQNEERFKSLSNDTKDFLAYTTGIKNLPEAQNEEGGQDMCKAIDDMLKDSWEEGIEKGGNEKLKLQIKKKLAKGKSVEVIADELEEEREVIEKLIAEMEAD